jgi:hypothetical protein
MSMKLCVDPESSNALRVAPLIITRSCIVFPDNARQGMKGDGGLLSCGWLIPLLLNDHLDHKELLANRSMTVREKIMTMKTLAILPTLGNFCRCELQCLRWQPIDRGHRRCLAGGWCSRWLAEDPGYWPARWLHGARGVTLGMGPCIHIHLIQGGWLLEGHVGAELLTQACC